jgi:hypothetical protein
MKTRFLLIIALLTTVLLSACQPEVINFTGDWNTNIALMTLTQEGNTVTGTMKGYGGYWNFDVAGTVDGSTMVFTGETPLGSLVIFLSEDGQTFQSTDPTTSFCGTRDAVLPDGCGFSGNWKIKSDLVPEGSVAKLTQTGKSITGAVFGPDDVELVPLNAKVEWGKGWQAVGTNDWGEFHLAMTSDEKAFELSAAGQFGAEWCGLREDQTSIYVFYFTCDIP